ncbi:MAG TPA: amidase family protein [Acidimicrobiia bacterium]
MDGIATRSATVLAAAIRSGEISSRELLDGYLDRIDRLGPPVNAVVTIDAERARAEAAQADDAAARGNWRGPLHGLPITIKDAIEVGGMRSTGGAVELRDHVPAADAPAVARLREAGAIVFGKTNVPRWSGEVQTFNEIFGTTNNPWALDRVPGGSSGGAAAAVAAGFTSFEIGTDIGGSVRIPAHCCGVFGLKPSFGVVPQRGYLDHVGGGLTDVDINVFGPIARSADDLELLLGVLAGPEPERALAWRLELPPPRRTGARDWKVGVWFETPGVPIDREELALLRNAADRLADAGAHVEDAHPPIDFDAQRDLFFTMITAAIAPSMSDDIADAAAGTHRSWLRADDQRAQLAARWAEWFEEYDALLCPVLPVPAFPHQQTESFLERTLLINGEVQPHMLLVGWLGLIGIVDLPSAVAPIGRTPEGLPVGVQVVTPFLRDRDAIALCAAIAEVSDGGYAVPPGF